MSFFSSDVTINIYGAKFWTLLSTDFKIDLRLQLPLGSSIPSLLMHWSFESENSEADNTKISLIEMLKYSSESLGVSLRLKGQIINPEQKLGNIHISQHDTT
jgi:hypothetical protein